MKKKTNKKVKEKFLNPGSDAAIAAGCKCAVMDNAHGRGYDGQKNVFSVYRGCPLHKHMMKGGKHK